MSDRNNVSSKDEIEDFDEIVSKEADEQLPVLHSIKNDIWLQLHDTYIRGAKFGYDYRDNHLGLNNKQLEDFLNMIKRERILVNTLKHCLNTKAVVIDSALKHEITKRLKEWRELGGEDE